MWTEKPGYKITSFILNSERETFLKVFHFCLNVKNNTLKITFFFEDFGDFVNTDSSFLN